MLILSQAVISMQRHVHEGSRRRLLGSTPAPEQLQALSAENRVSSSTPPTFIWTTKTDEMVDYQSSELFAAALRTASTTSCTSFPEGPHDCALSRAEKYAREWPEMPGVARAPRLHPVRADRRW